MGRLKTYATHFASIGGACWGLEQAGLECALAIELEEERVQLRKNNLGHQGVAIDIREYDFGPKDRADLLWTSPPCTMLSSASREYADPNHPLNQLYKESIRYCKQFRPKYFILENVMGLLTHKGDKRGGNDGKRQPYTWEIWKREFSELGYHVELNVLNSKFFGLPQNRERVFMVGSLEGKTGLIPAENLKIQTTFEDIMEKGSISECYAQQSYWTILECIARNTKKHGQEYPWKIVGPNSLFPKHNPPLDPYKHNILPTITCSFDGGPTRKKVSVIDSRDGINYMRNPTVREGARAQGFPEDWEFPDSVSTAWHFIGDAVSSNVARAIVEHLVKLESGGRPACKREMTASRISRYVRSMEVGMQQDMSLEMAHIDHLSDDQAQEDLYGKLG